MTFRVNNLVNNVCHFPDDVVRFASISRVLNFISFEDNLCQEFLCFAITAEQTETRYSVLWIILKSTISRKTTHLSSKWLYGSHRYFTIYCNHVHFAAAGDFACFGQSSRINIQSQPACLAFCITAGNFHDFHITFLLCIGCCCKCCFGNVFVLMVDSGIDW